ncbi:MAG: 16S rRNA (guanine(527)-N(7))-methyltransferase RsmG [Nitrospirae bacterium]|nr:16S rRNA (guanine(527)-N(7))-methyltransferase RsmG [Nitrospirota bacterium]
MPASDPIARQLAAGCAALGLAPTAAQGAALADYTARVLHWGRRMNLTGVGDPAAFVSGHVLDALAALPHLRAAPGQHWADVGSGSGVPGIPLAILSPEARWTLVEPREKRWAFLLDTIHRLKLANVTVLRARIDAAPIPDASQDGVVSRALGSPTLAAHRWLRPGGMIALYAGADPARWNAEAARLPLRPLPVVALTVPGVMAPRHLVRFEKVGEEG